MIIKKPKLCEVHQSHLVYLNIGVRGVVAYTCSCCINSQCKLTRDWVQLGPSIRQNTSKSNLDTVIDTINSKRRCFILNLCLPFFSVFNSPFIQICRQCHQAPQVEDACKAPPRLTNVCTHYPFSSTTTDKKSGKLGAMLGGCMDTH